MHNFVVGGDDRDFYRKLIMDHFADDECIFDKGLSTVASVVKAMKEAKMSLVMRYHAVLFAHTIDVPFKAIDYTNGGKIKGFLSDNNSLDKMITVDEVMESNFNKFL